MTDSLDQLDWQRIVSELMAKGLTQQAIGDRIGLTQGAISNISRGIQKSLEYSNGVRLMALHQQRCGAAAAA